MRADLNGPCLLLAFILLVILAGQGTANASASGAGDVPAILADAEAAYARRGQAARSDGRASPEAIGEAIEGYQVALEGRPGDLSIRWRLVRALYFAGDFSGEPVETRRRYLDRARGVGDVGLNQIAESFGDGESLEDFDAGEIRERIPSDRQRDVAILYFWTALSWGSWSATGGLFEAIREGVANRLYEYSEVVVTLEPGYYTGGVHRLRSHMHATIPRIPFLTGWVDRDQAVPEAEAALAVAPDERGNHVVYAMALLETRQEERERALALLREVAVLAPREESRVEDLAVRKLVRDRLVEEGGEADQGEGAAPTGSSS